MSVLPLDRRAVLGGVAGAAAVAGLPRAVAAVAPPDDLAETARTAAAWVRVRPEAGATVRLALLDANGRPARRFAPVRLEGGDTGASLWRQAHEAGHAAQGLIAAALAVVWGVPARECEIRPGEIAHPPSGRAMRHVVWIDVA